MGEVRAEQGSNDPLVGRSLSGGYRIVEPIAEGSMGRVYRAEQSTLGRAVAVKVMSDALVSNAEMVERFKNEARAASALNHPNCVRVYDFGQTPDGRPYFVMELLTGQDLELVLQAEPLQPITRVLDISLQILSALEEAHGLGVIHRDLKPGNVFVMPQRGGGDLVKVVDFGLAKLKSGISAPSGRVFGTPEYITPEQAMAKETDERTDLYACGVMLFEMVAGRLPFDAQSPQKLLEAHALKPPPKLAEIAAERSMFGLDEVVERALEKDPKKRYQTATEFADALREIVAYRTGERSVSDRKSWVRAAFKACTQCGNLNAPHARFCGECGETLGDRESVMPGFRPDALRETGPQHAMREPGIRDTAGRDPGPRETAGREPGPRETGPRAPAPREPGIRDTAGREPPRREPGIRDTAGREPGIRETAGREPGIRETAGREPGIRDTAGREPGIRDTAGRGPPPPTAARASVPPPGGKPVPRVDEPSKPLLSTSAEQNIREAIKSAESSGDPSSALVFLEQLATSRLKLGDPKSAILALKRGIDIARADLDKGDLDDPIRVVAIFSTKLGEAYLEAGEFSSSTRALKDALALSRGGAERSRIWLTLSRVARAQGHDKDAEDYLEAGDREAASSGRRASSPPQAANDSSSRRKKR